MHLFVLLGHIIRQTNLELTLVHLHLRLLATGWKASRFHVRSIHQCCDQLRGTLHTRGKTCNANTDLAGTSYTPTGWTDQIRYLGWVTYSKVMYLVWFLGYQWWVPFFPPLGGASPPNSSPAEILTWIDYFPKILTYWLSYQFRHHNPTQLEWTCHIRFNRENWEIQQLKCQLRKKTE